MVKKILGIIASVIYLLFVTVGDAVDELFLNVNSQIGGVMVVICGIFLVYCYIRYSRKNGTGFLYFVLYQIEYWISLIALVYGISFLDSINLWIPQKSRRIFFDLNGIEYLYYGILLGFFMLVLGLIYHIVLIVKNRK